MSLFAADAAPPGRPYWWDDGAPLPDLPTKPPARADLVIVGAGYTGLSAAITASREGASVCVIDSGVPGQGASTRNGGMFGAHPRLSLGQMTKRFGADTAKNVFQDSAAAFHATMGLIEDEGVDCDLQLTGRVQLAWTKVDFAAQQELVADMTKAADLQMSVLDREALSEEISTDRYFGGIVFPGHAAVHPRKFHDGLMSAALKRGVQIVQSCRVIGVERNSAGFQVRSAGGDIEAGKVILATNGYTGRTFGWLSRRIFALPSFIIATEKLSPNLLAELAPGRRMMVETRARHSYYRISPDGSRILFGGRASMTPMSPERAAKRLHQTMCDIWPALKRTRLTHSWSGFTGYTFNHLPQVGSHEGVHFACGFSGSGVALAPYLGIKAAYQALGDPRGETAFSDTVLATRPFHLGGTPWFLHAGELWFRNVVDRGQNRAARRDGRM